MPSRIANKDIVKEVIVDLPNDDFKPLSAIKLDALKPQSNNQRKPSAENLNDLRSILSTMVKDNKQPPTNKQPLPQASHSSSQNIKRETTDNRQESSMPKQEAKKTQEIPEADLKALLGVE